MKNCSVDEAMHTDVLVYMIVHVWCMYYCIYTLITSNALWNFKAVAMVWLLEKFHRLYLNIYSAVFHTIASNCLLQMF